ncbi:hypothetical protein IG631_11271 [Alternaria alternata]|nr:hypothetical protein IG631_11271 [Alternaria alternata]
MSPSPTPTPTPTPPPRRPSESDLRIYTSQPSLDVPAVGEAGRPPPVKFMCVLLSRLPRGGAGNSADARPGQHPHTRARYDTTSAQLPRQDVSRCDGRHALHATTR